MSLIKKIDEERTIHKRLVATCKEELNSMYHLGVGDGLNKAKEFVLSENDFWRREAIASKAEQGEEKIARYRNGWIPCSERLPKVGGYYLVTLEESFPKLMIGYYYTDYKIWHYWMSQKPIIDVLAWWPLPEPWKGENED